MVFAFQCGIQLSAAIHLCHHSGIDASFIPSRNIKAYATYTDDSKVPLESSQISWYTSDSNIAEVDDTGTITAIAPGIATIKTLYNGYEAELNVTVTASRNRAAF